MRLFRLMACCALLSSIALVGCNKDDDNEMEVEVEVTPVLEMGIYTAVKYTATNCTDASDNGEGVADCDSEDGCFKLDIKPDMTFDVIIKSEGEEIVWFEGDYTITDGIINLDYSKSTNVEQLFEGPVTANNKFEVTTIDPDDGCTLKTEYIK